MKNEVWRIGDVKITMIEEFGSWSPIDADLMKEASPDSVPDEIRATDWLRRDYLNENGEVYGAMRTYVIETPTRTIVMDTGLGNHKDRVLPIWQLDTDFLDRFTEIVDPTDVDVVVSSHLHLDHCGWNTKLVDGAWVPTFPNAEYLYVQKEYDHWKRYAEDPDFEDGYTEATRDIIDARGAFRDSIQPVVEAGLVRFVDADFEITPEVRMEAVHGHTPGHIVIRVDSQGQSAALPGDVVHTVWGLSRPDWRDGFDSDKAVGMQSRWEFFESVADKPVLLLTTHIGPVPAGHLVHEGDSFRLIPAPDTAV
ncbi:MBL fold metallo-hydrolase [Streptomyces sp. NPDC059255]|uniref:MBL fold metallo-hydrolase n=1 Tax=Streptomyces sp. NPDC059255 TaxID=3346793 RepID=UPI0036C521E5